MEQATRYFELRKQKEELEASLDEVKQQLGETEKELVLYMENQNLQNFTDKTFGTIYLRDQVYARIDDESVAYGWFVQNNLQDAWKLSIHNKTLCAIVKEHTEIPGVVTTWETKIGYRKA